MNFLPPRDGMLSPFGTSLCLQITRQGILMKRCLAELSNEELGGFDLLSLHLNAARDLPCAQPWDYAGRRKGGRRKGGEEKVSGTITLTGRLRLIRNRVWVERNELRMVV